MKTPTTHHKFTHVVRQVTVAALIAGMVFAPTTASAGLADKIQHVKGNVAELTNKVQNRVENIKDKVEDMDDDGLEQVTEAIQSMFQFIKQTQAGYKEFVGANRCGAGSPCSAFRAQLRGVFQSTIALPRELPFVEVIPPGVRQLEKIVGLIDVLPPVMLFAAEKVLGDTFEEIDYRMQMVRYAASQAPKLPTMAELNRASASNTTVASAAVTASDGGRARVNNRQRTSSDVSKHTTEPDPSFPYCVEVLETKKPHRELLTKTLEHLADSLWDSADLMEDSKTVGTAPGATTSIKNPVKSAVQVAALSIKFYRQVIEVKVAATASICALKGYQAPAN